MESNADHAVMELARRKIVELQAALDAKEPVTLSDRAVSALRDGTDAILASLAAAIEAHPIALAEVSKSLNAAVKQASKANTDHLKASTQAIRQIMDQRDAGTAAALSEVATISRNQVSLTESMTAALRELKPVKEKQESYQFDIQRDGNGYMKTVTATPVRPGDGKAQREGLEIS